MRDIAMGKAAERGPAAPPLGREPRSAGRRRTARPSKASCASFAGFRSPDCWPPRSSSSGRSCSRDTAGKCRSASGPMSRAAEWHFPARPGEPLPDDPDRDRCRTRAVRPSPGGRRARPQGRPGPAHPLGPLYAGYAAGDGQALAARSRDPRPRARQHRPMGAKAIGIDILIDQPQPEDPQLLAALKAMKTPVWLAYANRRHAADEIEQWQQQFMDNWSPPARRQPGPPDLGPVRSRTATMCFAAGRSLPPGLPPFMPLALAGAPPGFDYQGSIDFRVPANPERPVFAQLADRPVRRPGDRAVAGRPGPGPHRPDRRRSSRSRPVRNPVDPARRPDDERAGSPCDDARAVARRPPASASRIAFALGARDPRRAVRRLHRHARRPPLGRGAGGPRPAHLLRLARPSSSNGTGSIPTACPPSAGSAAGRWPMPRPAPRCARSGRSSGAMPSRRSANICPATSPRRSCAIPTKLSLTGEKRAHLHAVHRHRGLHRAQPPPSAGTGRDACSTPISTG